LRPVLVIRTPPVIAEQRAPPSLNMDVVATFVLKVAQNYFRYEWQPIRGDV
jgi:hypothetical protein